MFTSLNQYHVVLEVEPQFQLSPLSLNDIYVTAGNGQQCGSAPPGSQPSQEGPRGGWPSSFDAERYKERNAVERCTNKLRRHRVVATRYDKRELIYQGTIDVAFTWIWLRDPVT